MFYQKCLRILAFVAINGSTIQRKIEMTIEPSIDHPTIWKAVKWLVSERLLTTTNKGTKGRALRIDLTRAGLLWLGRENSSIFLLHPELARKRHDLLPEIFDLWPNIARAAGLSGCEVETRNLLRDYCNAAFVEGRRKATFGNERALGRLFDNFFLITNIKWRRVLVHDRKLIGPALEACRRRLAELSIEAEGYAKLFEAGGSESEGSALREAVRALNTSFPRVS